MQKTGSTTQHLRNNQMNRNTSSVTKAMIFSAGLGTRFKPWTDKHPKALALVNGKSLLQRNIEYLQQYGIKDIIVNIHHFADQVIDAINTIMAGEVISPSVMKPI
jgi:NDP-sugar pyrophosphorylase family protein